MARPPFWSFTALATALRNGVAISILLTCAIALSAQVNVNCTNTTADVGKLNTAIGNSESGDLIQIHGTCLVNSTIILLGDRTYVGDSRTGTIIRQASGSNLLAVVASDSWNDVCEKGNNSCKYTGDPIRIAHLTIDGNSAANSGTNALVIRSWLTTIEDLQVENAPEDGIQITNLNKTGIPLENTQVNGHISNVFVTNSGGNGIHVVDVGDSPSTGNSVTDWSLLDSWIANSGESAIYMDNAAGWTVRGNHVYGVRQHAIYANRCYATSIDQNYIEEFGSDNEKNTWYGIACTVNGGAASVISGNKVFMFAQEPASSNFVFIGLPKVNYGTGVVNVVNNTILGANGPNDIGLSYQINGGSGLDVLSSNNNVQAVHQPRSVAAGVTLVNGY
jgi:hypothetical protein